MSRPHLLIAGGGTGGHIAPALAVGRRASESFSVSYAATPRPVDALMYKKTERPVHVMNPPRVDTGLRLLFPFTATKALLKAVKLLKRDRVDVVLGTGGYSSFFAIAAAWIHGKPAAVFDSNAVSGRSNRFASRMCRMAFTGLPGGEAGLRCPAIRTGTPVSGGLKKMPSSEARRLLGIQEDNSVLLFLGGSQGARAINDAALSISEDVSILLQCGQRDYDRVRKAVTNTKNIVVKPFIDDLSTWYSAADLVVARSGGQTIAELAAFGLPAVFVPYPYAADDHQTANARVVENAGGALVRQQDSINFPEFGNFLSGLLADRRKLYDMSSRMASVFPEDPAGRIVESLLELTR